MKKRVYNKTMKKKNHFCFKIFVFLMNTILFLSLVGNALGNSVSLTGEDNYKEKSMSQEEFDRFIKEQIQSALERFKRRNQYAMEKAINRIIWGIEGFKTGVPEFVDDITGLKSKIIFLTKIGNDFYEKWLGDSTEAVKAREFIEKKFSEHIFSEKELLDLLTSSIADFFKDLITNQNKLYSDIKECYKRVGFNEDDLNIEQLIDEAKKKH